MDIYYLSRSLVPSKRADSIQVLQMCSSFAELDHDVTLYVMNGDGSPNASSRYNIGSNIDIKSVSRPLEHRIGNLLYAAKVGMELRKDDLPDVYYARDPYSLITVTQRSVPICLESHQPPSHRLRELVEKTIFSSGNFRKLIVISQALKEEYVERFEMLSPPDVLVAHDGARPIRDRVSQINLSGEPDRLDVGYVGSLYPGKGPRILPKIASKLPMMDFHIVGGQKEDLEMDCLPPNLHFYGYVPHSRVDDYLNGFDILVAPYQHEVASNASGDNDLSDWMSPLKIFEYMAAEKPIICSDLPVLREVLTDEQNCILVPPEEEVEWVNALHRLEDQDLRERLATSAYDHFKKNYTWEERAKSILKQINNVEK